MKGAVADRADEAGGGAAERGPREGRGSRRPRPGPQGRCTGGLFSRSIRGGGAGTLLSPGVVEQNESFFG